MKDSAPETLKHIDKVRLLMAKLSEEILRRALDHDWSKLNPPEKEYFDNFTEALSKLTYGSEEYKKSLEDLKPALEHHYAENMHHPEFHRDGINDMTLIDLIEMVCDWKAASERHENGDIFKSLEINKQRFGVEPQLAKILENTVKKYLL